MAEAAKTVITTAGLKKIEDELNDLKVNRRREVAEKPRMSSVKSKRAFPFWKKDSRILRLLTKEKLPLTRSV